MHLQFNAQLEAQAFECTSLPCLSQYQEDPSRTNQTSLASQQSRWGYQAIASHSVQLNRFTATSPLCRGAKWQVKLCQLNSKGLNHILTTYLGLSASASPAHLSQAPVSSVQTSSAVHEAATGHSSQYFISTCWTGNYSTLSAIMYTTYTHSAGQNFCGATKNQYRYFIVAHHQKRFLHTYVKVGRRGKASTARQREGPGAPKALPSEQSTLGPCSNCGAGGRVREDSFHSLSV